MKREGLNVVHFSQLHNMTVHICNMNAASDKVGEHDRTAKQKRANQWPAFSRRQGRLSAVLRRSFATSSAVW